MKWLLVNLFSITFSISFCQPAKEYFNPADLVNPLMGTQSKFSLSNGNTYPAISLPWAMNCWVPQTGKMGNGWIYTYDADKIRGFKQTHQPSPWINDYGQFSVLPETGKPRINEDDRASWFSHKAEIARPYYYQVYLADYDVLTEITPSERAAVLRFTYPRSDSSYVLVDAFDQGSSVQIDKNLHKISGYSTKNSGGVPGNFKNYFVIVFNKPFYESFTWKYGGEISVNSMITDKHTGALLRFKTSEDEQIVAYVASSFISLEQAEINLKEVLQRDFEEVKLEARNIWNKELGKIKVDGESESDIRTFYSCLYRTMLFPRKFYEYDKNGQVIHYSPYNGKVLPGYMFTDNGFWDTFRAAIPLINLLNPVLSSNIQEGLVNAYLESGWLPEWASPGHRDCMIGSNSASIVADAWLKGIRGYDINKLYEALLKNSENEGPLSSVGRKGVEYYNSLGYVPYDKGINENAARTLEYAYADYCIWKLSRALGRPANESDRFAKRCLNYINVFDSTSNLVRGRNSDGSFQAPFSPFKWGDAFTEGNSWHYTWSVFHDIQGLIDLMGGEETFVSMLDSVFKVPPVFDDSYYGFPIHEIREMQIMNMGNYAHGNQPVQHMVYLYNYAAEPWKTQFHVREVMHKLYSASPDGYCGDEDNGQTSAWYVFSAMGFYPVCPGSNQYVLGSPLFNKIEVQLDKGRKIEINALQNSDRNFYVKELMFNGKKYSPLWLDHTDLLKGCTLDFRMTDLPEESKRNVDDLPYSFSRN